MEFMEVVKKRRSIHYFTNDIVTNEDIDHILEAARWAPSAGNAQPWKFVVIRDPRNINKVWETTTGLNNITPQNFIRKAQLLVVVCTDITAYRGKQSNIFSDLYCIQDSANATMNLLLAVCDRGLGACWVGMFKENDLRNVIGAPKHIRPVAIVPIGHTKSKEKSKPRKPLAELVYYETIS